MRIKTTETKVYKWEELTDEQKEKALSKLYDLNTEYDWWDGVYDDAENVGIKITSFDLDRNRHAEGDFTQSAVDVARAIVAVHGEQCETYKTAKAFLDEYPEEPNEDSDEYPAWENAVEEHEEEFKRSIIEDYLIMLQNEYEYLSSEEAIIETIEANEYEFDENGNIA